jgi:hypothetical protein
MTLPQKGLRRITVEGTEYHWLVTLDDIGLHLIVCLVASSTQKMITSIEHVKKMAKNLLPSWPTPKS